MPGPTLLDFFSLCLTVSCLAVQVWQESLMRMSLRRWKILNIMRTALSK